MRELLKVQPFYERPRSKPRIIQAIRAKWLATDPLSSGGEFVIIFIPNDDC